MLELHHGGWLREAAAHYDIPLDEWLDLSTGINPKGWPVPELPASCWQRLPELNDGLESAAADYYGSTQLLPLAGSQAAIQLLPKLRKKGRVGMLQPCYAEHAVAWTRAGHEVVSLTPQTIERALSMLDVLLLVNPNNPTGDRFTNEQLFEWQRALQQRGGWLVIDEAFMDAEVEPSMVSYSGDEGLIVLRSLGKFFGLAGIRVGFLFAWPLLRKQMARELGPWHVSGPAREVARRALLDRTWQQTARVQLPQASQRLAGLLQESRLFTSGGTALFQYVPHAQAESLHRQLAAEGIFTRLFYEQPALRFGLPASEAEFQRLQQAIEKLQIKRKAG